MIHVDMDGNTITVLHCGYLVLCLLYLLIFVVCVFVVVVVFPRLILFVMCRKKLLYSLAVFPRVVVFVTSRIIFVMFVGIC